MTAWLILIHGHTQYSVLLDGLRHQQEDCNSIMYIRFFFIFYTVIYCGHAIVVLQVVYGRMKTYAHLSDKQFIKPDYQCDMLRVSMQMMRRAFYDEEEKIRYALSCSKVGFTRTKI